MKQDVERQLISVFITKKNRVVIQFKENVIVEPLLQGDESRNSNTIYTADSDEPFFSSDPITSFVVSPILDFAGTGDSSVSYELNK